MVGSERSNDGFRNNLFLEDTYVKYFDNRRQLPETIQDACIKIPCSAEIHYVWGPWNPGSGVIAAHDSEKERWIIHSHAVESLSGIIENWRLLRFGEISEDKAWTELQLRRLMLLARSRYIQDSIDRTLIPTQTKHSRSGCQQKLQNLHIWWATAGDEILVEDHVFEHQRIFHLAGSMACKIDPCSGQVMITIMSMNDVVSSQK